MERIQSVWRIIRNLFLGDNQDAHDIHLLRAFEITDIVNCAEEVPCWYPGEFNYLHLPMDDPDADFCEYIDDFCKFIRRGRKRGAVMVHCRAGRSRSPAVILAYLCSRGKTLDEAQEILRLGVEETEAEFLPPDASFLEQIEVYFEE